MSEVVEWNTSLYQSLLKELDEIEQATLTVTPGPWHRVTNSVMKRVPDPVVEGERYLPMRAEGQERPIPDEDFWNDVVMTEDHFVDLANKPGTGYIANADREEDAAHFARCDREFVLWLVKDYRARAVLHMPELGTNECAHDGARWPCAETRSVGQFIDQFHVE